MRRNALQCSLALCWTTTRLRSISLKIWQHQVFAGDNDLPDLAPRNGRYFTGNCDSRGFRKLSVCRPHILLCTLTGTNQGVPHVTPATFIACGILTESTREPELVLLGRLSVSVLAIEHTGYSRARRLSPFC